MRAAVTGMNTERTCEHTPGQARRWQGKTRYECVKCGQPVRKAKSGAYVRFDRCKCGKPKTVDSETCIDCMLEEAGDRFWDQLM